MDMPADNTVTPDCRTVGEILSRVGDKWTVQVVIALRDRSRRFNDLKREVNGISQQMLTRTLKILERDGLVARSVRPTTPPQVDYALTELGCSLSSLSANWHAGRGQISPQSTITVGIMI